MTSRKQTEANKRNAKEWSTGPKTKEGKDRARQNARKHGLTARAVVLSDEESKAYEEQSKSLHDELKPVGSIESWCVNNIAQCMWMMTVADGMRIEIFEDLRRRVLETATLESMSNDVQNLDDVHGYYSGMIAFLRTKEMELAREAEAKGKKNELPTLPLSAMVLDPELLGLRLQAQQGNRAARSARATMMAIDGVPLSETFLLDSMNGNSLEKTERYSTMWMNESDVWIRSQAACGTGSATCQRGAERPTVGKSVTGSWSVAPLQACPVPAHGVLMAASRLMAS